MHRTVFFAGLWIGLCSSTLLAERPNILLIYTDDQGSIDLHCYGATDLHTPHLDGLAERGVRFTQMLAPAPICSASRVGLLTGRMPLRAGQPGNGPMPTDEVTLAEVLQRAGYLTAHVGKWHLGKAAQQRPRSQGFDSSFGHMEGCIDNYSHFFFWNGPNRHDLWRDGVEVFQDGQYFPELMVSECQTRLDAFSQRDKPFFLYWAFNAPHYPYQGSDAWRQRYRQLPSPRDKYAAFVSTADECIGRVLAHLDKLGETENTIVVFQSDHGHSTETRAFGGGGNAGPYRGAKQSLFEGGLRVPSIISWPGHVPSGEVREAFATGCDWFPTLCALADVAVATDRVLDGRSLVGVIQRPDEPSPHKVFQWQFGQGERAQWAVRQGEWKLIGNPVDTSLPQEERKNGGRLDAPHFLANLEQDPSELVNLAEVHPEKVEELRQLRTLLLQELEP